MKKKIKQDCAFVMRLDQFLRCEPFILKDEKPKIPQGLRIEKGKYGGAICVATDGHRLGVLNCPDALFFSEGTWRIPVQLNINPRMQPYPWIVGMGRSLSVVEFAMEHVEYGDLIIDTPKLALARLDDCTERYENCLIDEAYPDWRKVVPTLEKNTMVRTFNSEYIKSFGKYLSILGNASDRPHVVIDHCEPDFIGVLMPMQGELVIPDWL